MTATFPAAVAVSPTLAELEPDPLDQLLSIWPATTSTSSTTTTRPGPTEPPPVPASTKSEVFPSVRLTLAAEPPPSGATRTARFWVETEFGDARVLRAVSIDLGDGTVIDGSVEQWSCWNPAAPNPYLFSGPTHVYPGPGSYVVTATAQTAGCAPGDDDPMPEETVRTQLVLNVP